MFGGDLDGFLDAPAFDDVEPADRLFRFNEWTVHDGRLPVAHPDGARSTRRGQLVAGDPSPARLELVEPRKALLFRWLSGVGLRLGVHPLGVPADEHQEFHRRSSILNSLYARTTNWLERNRQGF